MMKTTWILFPLAMLILAGTLAACDSKAPGKTTPSMSSAVPDATAEVGEKVENTAGKAGQVLGDSAITAKAKLALANTPDLKSMNISVDTVQGRVTLTGHVPSETDIRKAGVVVSGLEGVKSVDNKLAVKSPA
jgi:hyperosmotically inducible protein